jgi:hypothetical protein
MKIFTDKDRQAWNNDIRELNEVIDEAKKAEQAGVQGGQALAERCNTCLEGYQAMKKAYFPNKP